MDGDAYRRMQGLCASPRALEQRLLDQVTGRLEQEWLAGRRGIALVGALHDNREMWGTFSAACAARGNGLPDALRAQIVSLALWVDRHSSAVVRGEEEVAALVAVNRALIDGLAAAPSRAA